MSSGHFGKSCKYGQGASLTAPFRCFFDNPPFIIFRLACDLATNLCAVSSNYPFAALGLCEQNYSVPRITELYGTGLQAHASELGLAVFVLRGSRPGRITCLGTQWLPCCRTPFFIIRNTIPRVFQMHWNEHELRIAVCIWIYKPSLSGVSVCKL